MLEHVETMRNDGTLIHKKNNVDSFTMVDVAVMEIILQIKINVFIDVIKVSLLLLQLLLYLQLMLQHQNRLQKVLFLKRLKI